METASDMSPAGTGQMVGRRMLDRRYNKTGRTIDRWMRDERVRFPRPAMMINGRRYWSLRDIEAWEREQVTKVAEAA